MTIRIRRKKFAESVLGMCIAFLFVATAWSREPAPIMEWDFSTIDSGKTIERQSEIADVVEGNAAAAPGIAGQGLRLDGFTACVRRKTQEKIPAVDESFTVEAWVALGNYPWNWCPVLTMAGDETEGYRLMIGPHGEVSLQVATAEQWVECTTERLTMPLRKWRHIVGVYKADRGMKVYVDGELEASMPVQGEVSYASGNQAACLLGMVATPKKPSDIHRTWGTVAQYFGLNGIIDEVRVYDEALSPERVRSDFAAADVGAPAIEPHRLPRVDNRPSRFGAFYTKLEYYDGWDDLWPVGEHPDIVVCFDKSPVDVVFWRGIRYGAAWVSENDNWMTDQSVEAWGVGENDVEGCFEHMQDRHCRMSHVRIIENNPARVVVHWRYAPVSSHNNMWRVDPKTGWGCWIDEYYYIYPDAAGIRKVTWEKGSLKHPRQLQESLPLLHPEQMKGELLHKDYVHVADYEGHIDPVSFVENPGERDRSFAQDYTIQQYNFKSENKPFICFEPGNRMKVRWNDIDSYNRHVGCNHFPVGQARCDGRTSTTADRPSHCDSFPISNPVVHEEGDRCFWNGLYGMNGMDMEELVEFGRGWAYPPAMDVGGEGFSTGGYDRSERCYRINNEAGKARKLEVLLAGSSESPVYNPALMVEKWNTEPAEILVDGEPAEDARVGLRRTLAGDDLIVFLFLQSDKPVEITIAP